MKNKSEKWEKEFEKKTQYGLFLKDKTCLKNSLFSEDEYPDPLYELSIEKVKKFIAHLLKEQREELKGKVEGTKKESLYLARNVDTGEMIGLFENYKDAPILADGATCTEAYNQALEDIIKLLK
jgi:hypothetical protein